jgi:DNA-binding NarL/FixJ family response regulator
MPGIDGLELTRWTKERFPLTEVVLVTGHSSIETAVRAMQLGACDYLIKPLSDPTCVDRSLNLALERRRRALALRSNPRLWLAGLVEHLPLAVVLVDSDRKLLAANRLGQEMLTLGQTLLLGDGNTVACVDTAATSRLACLVRAAHASGSHLEALDLGACTGAVLGLGDDGPDRVAAIALPAGLSASKRLERLLEELYGLTHAEARVAALLVEGASIEQASARLGVSVNTTKTHLSRVFDKTGTSRQAELVATLLLGPGLLAVGA